MPGSADRVEVSSDAQLVAAAVRAAEDAPAVRPEAIERGRRALQDGTLVLWRLESQSDAVREWALGPFVEQLRAFEAAGVPIASYISAPAAAEVMNALRPRLAGRADMAQVSALVKARLAG